MIAHISTTGMLTIEPETELEAYALKMWAHMNNKDMIKVDILISNHIVEKPIEQLKN